MSNTQEVTQEHLDLIKVVQEEWIALGIRSGAEVDEEQCRKSIDWLYKLNGYEPPKDLYFVGSPRAMQELAMKLLEIDEPVSSASRGIAYDGGWSAFYDYYQRLGVKQGENFDEWLKFLRAGIWDTVLCDEAAIICRRPIEVHYDDQNRLHSTTGPAVTWSDGQKSYVVTGIYIEDPSWIIDPGSITADAVLKQDNVELRRIMLSLMGMENFVAQAKSTVLDEWVDGGGQPGKLLKIKQKNDEDIVLYQFTDASTYKVGFLRVPPTMKTCLEAVAWGFDIDPKVYKPQTEM